MSDNWLVRYSNLSGISMRFLVLRKFSVLNERNAADTHKWFDECYPSSTSSSLRINIFTLWMRKAREDVL